MSFRSTNSKRVIFGPSTCQFGYEHATRSFNLENAVQFQILPKVGYMLCSYLSVVSSTHLQLVLFFSSSNGITHARAKTAACQEQRQSTLCPCPKNRGKNAKRHGRNDRMTHLFISPSCISIIDH